MNQPFFCAELARQSAEPLHGTASQFQCLFLLEYNDAWGAKALADSTLSDVVKQAINVQLQTMPQSRLLLIKQSEKHTGLIRFFAVVNHPTEPYYNTFQFNSYDDLIGFDFAQALVRHETSQTEPFYLICTNGNKDKCCAKYGMAAYKDLQTKIDPQRVWQCTHLGGDRFTPNIVMAPAGLYFGRLQPDNMNAFVIAVENDHIDLAHYRGRCCYSQNVQAAEYFARQILNNTAIADLELQANDAERVAFRERSTGRQITVELTKTTSDYQLYLTCQSVEASPVTLFHLVEHDINPSLCSAR